MMDIGVKAIVITVFGVDRLLKKQKKDELTITVFGRFLAVSLGIDFSYLGGIVG